MPGIYRRFAINTLINNPLLSSNSLIAMSHFLHGIPAFSGDKFGFFFNLGRVGQFTQLTRRMR